MDPLKRYQAKLETHAFKKDAAQEKAIAAFGEITRQLEEDTRKRNSLIHGILRAIPGHSTTAVKGLYLWGSVGRGKTWLMNLFYQSLPFENKLRIHFHHFMLDVHEQLAQLQQQKNPLKILARHYADNYRVICLDEFIVTNITDAMLLSGLLDALFEHGVTLIATSNRIPDDLYKNGLQRERFLPAIDLIKQHTRVMHLDGDTDHRLELLEQTNIYYTPITEASEQQLRACFNALITDSAEENAVLTVKKRPIQTIVCADEIAWFEFNVLCGSPRATPDYIELAEEFHSILLSNVPVMDESLDDKARRFIYLVDELYDRNVKLIVSADAPPEFLYTGNMLEFAFHRTSSRLIEMRSENYLAKAHRTTE